MAHLRSHPRFQIARSLERLASVHSSRNLMTGANCTNRRLIAYLIVPHIWLAHLLNSSFNLYPINVKWQVFHYV